MKMQAISKMSVSVISCGRGQHRTAERITGGGPGVKRDARPAHGGDWFTTGENSPRAVSKIFSGISFSSDGQLLVYCSEEAADHSFRLHTVYVGGGEVLPVVGSDPHWPSATVWAAPYQKKIK
ncbi:MAG: hypothetical protein HY717_20895 [Planctomycetes bacterium]|nr:hypothetical protein [Planctomycetota bacterium]